MAYRSKHEYAGKRHDIYDEVMEIARRDLKLIAGTTRTVRFAVLSDAAAPTRGDNPTHWAHDSLVEDCCYDGFHHEHPWSCHDLMHRHHHPRRYLALSDISGCTPNVAVADISGITATAKLAKEKGIVTVTFKSTASAKEAASGNYQVKLTDGDGAVTMLSYGVITLEPNQVREA